MRDKKEMTEIYKKLNDNEKYGIQFGLFPAWLLKYNFSTEETVLLMEIRKETEKTDVNKI